MSPRTPRFWLSVLALCGLALLGLCCVRGGAPTDLQTAYPVSPKDESAPESSTTAPVQDTPIDAHPAVSDGDAGALEQPAGTQDNPVARLMRSGDAHDRDLLAEVERSTGRGASTSIVELVQQRKAGASAAQLQPLIAQLPDLRERTAAQRWFRAVFPGQSSAVHTSPTPGEEGGPQRLTPLQRTQQ